MLRKVSCVLAFACWSTLLLGSAAMSAQPPGANANALANAVNGEGRVPPISEDSRKFDPRDLSGIWRGALYAYGRNVPAFTEEGLRRFEANKPSYGIAADSPQAKTRTDLHIGRRRAVVPGINNDPALPCNPMGLTRILLFTAAPVEIIQLPNRLIQRFEWTWDHREIWVDGRSLPDVKDNLPRWNGYSTGRWEGDTFVVETSGFDDRQWMDHYGYPISNGAKLIERWRRVNYSNLELRMTLIDPELYTAPYESDIARFSLQEGPLNNQWDALIEDRCAPLDINPFIEEVVLPVSGVTK